MSLYDPTDNYPFIANPTREDMLRAGVYQIRNLVTDKIDVGSASEFKQRWASHKALLRRPGAIHHSPYLQYAWDKYGEECFAFEIIEFVTLCGDAGIDRTILLAREQIWLDRTQSYDTRYGYNMRSAANSRLGYPDKKKKRNASTAPKEKRKRGPHSNQTKANMREGSARRVAREKALREAGDPGQLVRDREFKERLSVSKTGKKQSPEQIAAQKADEVNNKRLRKLAEEQRGKPGPLVGKPKPPEHCEAMKEGWAKRKERLATEGVPPKEFSLEHKAALKASLDGRLSRERALREAGDPEQLAKDAATAEKQKATKARKKAERTEPRQFSPEHKAAMKVSLDIRVAREKALREAGDPEQLAKDAAWSEKHKATKARKKAERLAAQQTQADLDSFPVES